MLLVQVHVLLSANRRHHRAVRCFDTVQTPASGDSLAIYTVQTVLERDYRCEAATTATHQANL